MKKQLIWVFEWRKSVHYWWSYILFSPECKELTSILHPLLYRWSAPPVVIRCVHWTMQMEVLQTWITTQSTAIVMSHRLVIYRHEAVLCCANHWRLEQTPGHCCRAGHTYSLWTSQAVLSAGHTCAIAVHSIHSWFTPWGVLWIAVKTRQER